MSFSSELKAELTPLFPKSAHCRIAELAGILSVSGRVEIDKEGSGDIEYIFIRVDKTELEDKIKKLLKAVLMLGDEQDKIIITDSKSHKNSHKIMIVDEAQIKKLREVLKINVYDGNKLCSMPIVIERNCCKKAYLRGAFLAGGSINTPEKAYLLEISAISEKEAVRLVDTLISLDINAKYVKRKDRFMVYVKEGNNISNLLGEMGAMNSLMNFENVRIVKDVRNNINREVNCDTANIAKTAKSAARQIEDIEFIAKCMGLEQLPDQLRETAELRLKYPLLSIKEIGEKMNPPVGKSGISHRLRKLNALADDLRRTH